MERPRPYEEIGRALKHFRLSLDLTQLEVVAGLEPDQVCEERTYRRWESGETVPPRKVLILLLSKIFKVRDVENLNGLLDAADYKGVDSDDEIQQYGLSKRQISNASSKFMTAITAGAYIHPNGRFQKEGAVWREYRNDEPQKPFEFEEFWRDNDYIWLYDATRQREKGHPLYVRIPIAGGIVQWSYPDPIHWEDLLVVKPYIGVHKHGA